jgi:hypothetical protein
MSSIANLLTRRMVQIATDAGRMAWPTCEPEPGVVVCIDHGIAPDGAQHLEFETVHTFGDLRRVLAR